MSRAVVGGKLFLPYQDDEGNDVPVSSGEVVYKMSALTVDGQVIRVPSTIIASIRNGVLEPKGLVYGVWTAEIRPHSPSGYAKRIKFLADKPEMDLADVIPIPIDGMEVVRGEDGRSITSIVSDEVEGSITIEMSDGVVYSFPLPRAALSVVDQGILDQALEAVTDGESTVAALASALQESVDGTQADLQSTLQALADGVAQVQQSGTVAADAATTATSTRDAATTSASNALSYANEAQESAEAAQTAETGAQQALTDLQAGIASGEFKGEKGDAGTTTWGGITDKPDLSGFVSSTSISGIWAGTQAQYDALVIDPQTLYVIQEG